MILVSCSKNEATPTPQPSPDPTPVAKSFEYRVGIKVEANDDAKEMFDFTGSKLVCDNKEINIADALAVSSSFEEPDLKSDAPGKTYLKINVTPKNDFTPQKGKKYDVKVPATLRVTVVDKATGKNVETTGSKEGGASIIGVNFDKAEELGKSVSMVLNSIKDAINYEIGFSISASGEITRSN